MNKIITVTKLLTFARKSSRMICEEKKKKKTYQRTVLQRVQKQREKREGREIDREWNLLVIEVEPKQTFWRC